MTAKTFQGRQPAVWALADDRAGNRSQCLGVADALGFAYTVKELRYGGLAWLPNRLLGASFAGIDGPSRAALTPPWPEVVIAAGRRTAPVARKIKRLAGGRCFLAQVMHPGGGAGDFDLIAAPGHDRPRLFGSAMGANVMTITGAPHRLTKGRLDEAAAHWRGRFDHLPRPWIALIVGGSTRRRRFTEAMARELAARASRMALAAGGALLVTTSRRTGDDATAALTGVLAAPARVHNWGEGSDGDNPYGGYLALADAVIVTGDSASMCSEACAATAPVYIFAPPALTTAKHARLHAELYEKGYARPLAGILQEWSHPPLNAAGDVAAAILDRLGVATPGARNP